jgi:peptidoglycan/LPS O-acetylase OafA/YrhL
MRNKQFDLIRFFSAVMVVLSHSFDLLDKRGAEPLYWFTKGRFIFSDIGIYTFFIISGYLISQSLNSTHSLVAFYWKRFLRIFPALVVVVLLTVFIVGPVITVVVLPEYFSSRYTWLYLLNASLIQMHVLLPGVFQNNPVKYVNGSLWTLQYEVLMYLVISIQKGFILVKQPKLFSVILLLFFLALWFLGVEYVIPLVRLSLDKIGLFGALFALGMVVNNCGINQYINKLNWIFILLVAVTMLMLLPKSLFIFIALPLMIFKLSGGNEGIINKLTGLGDVSYGLYISAFLIQQIVINYFSQLVLVVFLVPIIIGWCFGLASWKFIEQPALRMKKKFR